MKRGFLVEGRVFISCYRGGERARNFSSLSGRAWSVIKETRASPSILKLRNNFLSRVEQRGNRTRRWNKRNSVSSFQRTTTCLTIVLNILNIHDEREIEEDRSKDRFEWIVDRRSKNHEPFCEIETKIHRVIIGMEFPFFLSSFFFSTGSKFKDKEIILIFVPVIYLDHPRFLKSCRVSRANIIWRANLLSRASSPIPRKSSPQRISFSGRGRFFEVDPCHHWKLLKLSNPKWK